MRRGQTYVLATQEAENAAHHEWRGRHGAIHFQELPVEALDAQVQQIGDVCVWRGVVLRKAVLVEGQHAAREVDGIAVEINHALHPVAELDLIVRQRCARCAAGM